MIRLNDQVDNMFEHDIIIRNQRSCILQNPNYLLSNNKQNSLPEEGVW